MDGRELDVCYDPCPFNADEVGPLCFAQCPKSMVTCYGLCMASQSDCDTLFAMYRNPIDNLIYKLSENSELPSSQMPFDQMATIYGDNKDAGEMLTRLFSEYPDCDAMDTPPQMAPGPWQQKPSKQGSSASSPPMMGPM